jgi:hypothetical protein
MKFKEIKGFKRDLFLVIGTSSITVSIVLIYLSIPLLHPFLCSISLISLLVNIIFFSCLGLLFLWKYSIEVKHENM